MPKLNPSGAAAAASVRGDPRVVLSWFESQPGIPLVPPPRFREYGPLSDDPDYPDADFPVRFIAGATFGIEYLDQKGWASTRTVRCIGLDPGRPALLKAYCNVRKTIRMFRLDRIISTTNLRTGVTTQTGAQSVLFAPAFLPEEPCCQAFIRLLDAVRPGVFLLLFLAMRNGWLSVDARDVALAHVLAEAEHRGIVLPPADLLTLWLENLSPSKEAVVEGVAQLLDEPDSLVRLMPRILEIRRTFSSATHEDGALHGLIRAFRMYLLPRPAAPATDLIPWR